MIWYFFIASILYIPIRLILFFIIYRFGRLSYNEFQAAGFKYDPDNDAFYSTKDAWQKDFGYCKLYDISAPYFQMIMDTEPVRFYYNNKNWLITFWKGQYGITTGAEIGVYNTTSQQNSKRTIYFPANEEEMLDMSFILYKKGEEIMKIKDKHWWLALFKIGTFSKPKNLTMDIEITFPNKEMLNSFLKAFKKLGYKEKNYKVKNYTFSFKYKRPKFRIPWPKISTYIRQSINRKNVKMYNDYIGDLFDNNNNNRQIKLQKIVPKILENPSINNLIPKENIEISQIKEEQDNNIFLNKSVYSNLKKENNE